MRRRQMLELGLFVIGLGAAVAVAVPSVRAVLAERSASATVIAAQATSQLGTVDGPILTSNSLSSTYLDHADEEKGLSHVIGILKISSLDLAVPIVSGIAESDLARGVGHVPGSGYAGGLGNMVVAGHRDTFFRPLRSVASGMDVILTTGAKSYRYRIDRTEVVKPDQLRVLDIGSRPELTMITCYPFNFLGAAPERFVVHAYLLSVDPEQPAR